MLDFAEIENTRGSMKIFIFEPYKWDYCGGGIVIIAFSFKEAVELIVKETYDPNNSYTEQQFKKEYFAKDKAEFEDVDREWDTWVLTHEIETTEVKQRIVMINYNYA